MKIHNVAPQLFILQSHYLDLPNNAALTRDLINAIESVCNTAEDSGPNCLLVFRFNNETTAYSNAAAAPPVDIALINKWEAALSRLERASAVSVCLVDGDLRGYSSALLLATDFRIATSNSTIAITDGDRPIMPGMVLHRLANQIGAGASRPIALFGKVLTAADARTISLVDLVEDDLDLALSRACNSWAPAHIDDIRVRRALLLEAGAMTSEQVLGTHLAACDRTLRKYR
jgi:isomerase DpgB